MGFDIDKWYLQKMQGEVIVRYMGEICSDKITETLNAIESSLNLKNEKNQTRKKVWSNYFSQGQLLLSNIYR